MKQKLFALLLLTALLLTGCHPSALPDSSVPPQTTLVTEIPQSTGSLESTGGTEATTPSETAKPSEPTQPTETVKPTDSTKPTDPTAPNPPSVQPLNVHYIDVGQADSILLECGGKFMLIDGGNVADSSLVVSYLLDQGVQELEAVVCTHAHEDHVGGLPGVLAVFPVKKVYAPTKTYSSKCFDDFVYYVDQQRLEITIPKPGDRFSLGDAQVAVLGPVKSYSETNNTSIVLMVTLAETKFLFTGDMESKAETDMLDYWDGKADLSADVLKVGHHGSSTSTCYRFLYEVNPVFSVISVGAGNQFGHPNKEPLSRLEDAEVTQFRTDKQGHIVATSDGVKITFTWKNANVKPDGPEVPRVDPSKPTDSAQSTAPTESAPRYIGHKTSKKLHLPTCGSLPSEVNRVYFDDYDEAIAQGYTPCSKCKPGN